MQTGMFFFPGSQLQNMLARAQNFSKKEILVNYYFLYFQIYYLFLLWLDIAKFDSLGF